MSVSEGAAPHLERGCSAARSSPSALCVRASSSCIGMLDLICVSNFAHEQQQPWWFCMLLHAACWDTQEQSCSQAWRRVLTVGGQTLNLLVQFFHDTGSRTTKQQGSPHNAC